jgi:hypothetical protein
VYLTHGKGVGLKENEVVHVSKYPTLDVVEETVELWSVPLRKEFQVIKCSSSVYDVKYVHDGCPWRVHVSKGRWKTH